MARENGEEYRSVALGSWCRNQRNLYKNKVLSQERINKLNQLGFFSYTLGDRWQERYDLLAKYRQHYPDHWPVQSTEYAGTMLGSWCSSQRLSFEKKSLEAGRIEMLNKLCFPWDPYYDQWQENYLLLVKYLQQYEQWPIRKGLLKVQILSGGVVFNKSLTRNECWVQAKS